MRSVIVLPSAMSMAARTRILTYSVGFLMGAPPSRTFSPESACVLCCYFLASIFDFLLTIRVWIPPRQAKALGSVFGRLR